MILPHCGHYYYNNKIYFKREDTLDDMLLNKDYTSSIQFYYNDHIFGAIDWTAPITISLDDLYKLRAQQLRDEYKYLILLFSGGADSSQILNTFLKNDIFIDEIVCLHTTALANKFDFSTHDDEMKYFLEYEYAALPLLKKVADLSPNTKITSVDQTNFMIDSYVNKKFTHLGLEKNEIATTGTFSNRGSSTFFNMIYYPENNTEDLNKIAVIRGFEKPNLHIENNELFFQFFDITMHQTKDIRKNKKDKITLEDFYWSPNFPLIPIKQSQVIKTALETNYEFFNLFYSLQNANKKHKRTKNILLDKFWHFGPILILERKFSNFIYPDFNNQQFVAPKPRKINVEEMLITNTLKINAADVMDEYKHYTIKKYDLIENKRQLRDMISSRLYSLGKLDLRWKNEESKEKIFEIIKSILNNN